jgi:hypothetical protein
MIRTFAADEAQLQAMIMTGSDRPARCEHYEYLYYICLSEGFSIPSGSCLLPALPFRSFMATGRRNDRLLTLWPTFFRPGDC